MYILLAVEFIVGIVLLIISKVFSIKKGRKIGKHLLKEGFLTLILFNIFNISFSAGLHWKYAESTSDSISSTILLYAILAIILFTFLALETTKKKEYGEYKNKFKKRW